MVRNVFDGADFEELARTQLRPFAESARVQLNGPKVSLGLQVAQGMELAINELAANAIKYGALASPNGVIELTWKQIGSSENRGLEVCWKEPTDRQVVQPTRHGLGTKLIEHGIPGARVNQHFITSGVVCTIEFT